ncbi:USP6 N-terminal-like protein isoform X1 [Lates japonicus]|uniref:USP6 N-terminal-like protein isoform X1 n=1 Tax=Lates japonicus TaxID=270547 RepID=A0AAD3RKR1_LATJO|nr:USP6 N-terminal-like protein isoform X1 [Lates japonicus]
MRDRWLRDQLCRLRLSRIKKRGTDYLERLRRKYDKGKEAPVEPWEDTNFHLYKVIDRFGFVHENELPSYDSVEEKQKHTEVERTTKWLKMLKSWDKYKNSEKYRPHRVHIGPLLPSAAVVLLVTDAEECLSQSASTEDN